MWILERQKRFASSSFGRIMNRKAEVTETFITLLNSPAKFTSKQTGY